MLTVGHLEIFATWAGDLDGWTRQATDRGPMTQADWQLIDELLLGLALVNNGVASPAYARVLDARIAAAVADEAAHRALLALPARLSRHGV